MESPKSKYFKGHGFHSSSNKHGRPVKFSKNSRRSELVSSSNRRLPSHELPLHLKRPFKMSSAKMSSPKRSHSGNESDNRPPKQQKVEEKEKGPHGFEELLVNQPQMAPVTTTTLLPTEQYHRRIKVAKHARVILQKRAISNSIRSDSEMMPSSSRKGMANITGVLCYRNSLLQAILHSPKLINWLLLNHHADDCVEEDTDNCVACALRELAITYWGGGKLIEDLKFTNNVFNFNKWYAGPTGQGDPEDQFTWIMKMISNQLPKNVYRQLESFHCLVADISIRCRCGHASKTDGHVTGPVPVALKPRLSNGLLSLYLDRYFNETVSEYRCEKCNNAEDKSRVHQITHFPDILLIQLKRFDWNGRKINSFVKISPNLNLDKFRAPDNKDDSNYELSAVVCHSGTLGSGHYICFAKANNGVWLEFDDHSVSPAKPSQFLGQTTGFTPYLLFFQRSKK